MSDKPKIIGILLAAGAGIRFGGDKGLATLPDGTAMAVKSAENLRSHVDEVICVIRAEDQTLQAIFEQAGFKTVICKNAELGMSASLHQGILASLGAGVLPRLQAEICLPTETESGPEVRGWLIALADMPLIADSTYSGIIKHIGDQQIIVPVFDQREGHPVYFPARFREDLLALKGDKGAKKLLHQFPYQVRRINVRDSGIHQDFDTKASFKRYFTEDQD